MKARASPPTSDQGPRALGGRPRAGAANIFFLGELKEVHSKRSTPDISKKMGPKNGDKEG